MSIDPFTPGGATSILGSAVSSRSYRPPVRGAMLCDGVTVAHHADATIVVTWGGHLYCATPDRQVAAERARYARRVAIKSARSYRGDTNAE